MNKPKRIAVLGCTGSIGTQALDVIRKNPEHFVAEVLVGNSNAELLIQQALEFKPNAVVIADESKYKEVKDPKGTRIFGPIAKELKDNGFNKIASLAEEIY